MKISSLAVATLSTATATFAQKKATPKGFDRSQAAAAGAAIRHREEAKDSRAKADAAELTSKVSRYSTVPIEHELGEDEHGVITKLRTIASTTSQQTLTRQTSRRVADTKEELVDIDVGLIAGSKRSLAGGMMVGLASLYDDVRNGLSFSNPPRTVPNASGRRLRRLHSL